MNTSDEQIYTFVRESLHNTVWNSIHELVKHFEYFDVADEIALQLTDFYSIETGVVGLLFDYEFD